MQLLRILSFPVILILAVMVTTSSLEATKNYRQVCDRLDVGGHVGITVESILEGLTLGLYTGGTDRVNDINTLRESAENYYNRATLLGWSLFLLSLGLVVGGAFSTGKFRFTSLSIPDTITVSVVFLLIGLIAPVINLVAYNDVALIGTVVFKFESKGILLTIYELFKNGNWLLSLLVFLFSVIVPCVKTVLIINVYRAGPENGNGKTIRFLAIAGKWSMTDVFVVAILLAFFAIGADKGTDSWLSHGLYFFAGYCILSMMTFHLVQKRVKFEKAEIVTDY